MARLEYLSSEENFDRLLHAYAVGVVTRDPEMIREIQWRLRFDLTPELAAEVGLAFDDLKAFAGGLKLPRRDPLARLARRLGVHP